MKTIIIFYKLFFVSREPINLDFLKQFAFYIPSIMIISDFFYTGSLPSHATSPVFYPALMMTIVAIVVCLYIKISPPVLSTTSICNRKFLSLYAQLQQFFLGLLNFSPNFGSVQVKNCVSSGSVIAICDYTLESLLSHCVHIFKASVAILDFFEFLLQSPSFLQQHSKYSFLIMQLIFNYHSLVKHVSLFQGHWMVCQNSGQLLDRQIALVTTCY